MIRRNIHTQRPSDLPPVRTAYGLDVGKGYAAVVRAHLARSGVHEDVLLETCTDDLKTALIESAQHAHAEIALHKAILCAALPAQESMIRWLEAPLPSINKARKVLPSLLDIQLPFPLETCVHGFPVLETSDTGRICALAIAARRENVETRLAECAELNMDPQCLDHEGWALWTQSLFEHPDVSGFRIVTYLGVDRTVWVMGENERLLNAHASKLGADQLANAAVDRPEPSTREWRDRAMRYLRAQTTNRSDTPMHWIWTGPGAKDKALIRTLETLLLAEQDTLTFSIHDRPATFLARALALRALRPHESLWNFRTGDLAQPAIRRWRERARRQTAWTALAAGLILCAFNLAFGALTNMQNRRADRELEQQAKTITGYPSIPRGQERIVTQRAVEEQREQLHPFLHAFQPSHTEVLRDILQWGWSGGLHYESVTLRPDHLLIQGVADDWDACEVLKDQLNAEGWTVQLDRQEAVAVEHVRFRLTAGRDS